MNQRRPKMSAQPQAQKKAPLLVGGARNEHGTRICKRVQCEKCKAVDYITSRPVKGRDMWCRSCAQEMLNAFEVGVRIPTELVKRRCTVCKCLFELPAMARVKDNKPLCRNCMRGFDVWRGSLDMSPDTRQDMQLETRPSGTLLRKKRPAKNLNA